LGPQPGRIDGSKPHALPIPLSIVIPSHNRWDLLRRCLQTVTAHAPPATEVIVVDDASPGGRVSAVAGGFAGVRVLQLGQRGGFSTAVNTGMAVAQADVVEVLNDDTEVAPHWAEPALACFADPAVAAVAPLVLLGPQGRFVDSAGDRYYLGGVAGKRGHGQPVGPGWLKPCPVFGASASSAFYRRAAVLEVGGLPAHFGAYFEDVDLAFRLNRAGYRALFEPRSRVLHLLSASHGGRQRRLLEQQSCNEERVFWRNLPARRLPAALPRHLAVLAAKAWRRWQEATLAPFLCGRLRVLGEVPALIRHRRWLRRLGPAGDEHVEKRFWGRFVD
jgi:GT2 family glycosyltransferase